MAARWLVLFPGAAQASITWPPTGGFRRYAGRQLAYNKANIKTIVSYHSHSQIECHIASISVCVCVGCAWCPIQSELLLL